MRLRLLAATFMLQSCFWVGCSSSDGPDLVEVTGTITLDGDPLDRAAVIFQPENGRPSVGATDSSGRYSLLYKTGVSGALLGKHRVFIRSEVGETGDGEGEALQPGREEILPSRYHDESELVADVTEENRVIDFDLKSE